MVQKRMILKGNVLVGDMFTKYGLDANVLVDLVLYPKAKDYFQQRGTPFRISFCALFINALEKPKGF